jgi:hypothetical protein
MRLLRCFGYVTHCLYCEEEGFGGRGCRRGEEGSLGGRRVVAQVNCVEQNG